MVLRYYEAVKDLRHCRRSPLFWLQYAIASLFSADFDRAGTYFESAYSFAEQSNFRTFQIDNHFARYLLLRAIHDGFSEQAVEMFRKARALIFEQMRHERLHYPYRVATLISEWYWTFVDRLSSEQKEEVKRAASFIAAKISELPEHRQKHKEIVDCYKKMRALVDEAIKS